VRDEEEEENGGESLCGYPDKIWEGEERIVEVWREAV
jgi:hypothetical protein